MKETLIVYIGYFGFLESFGFLFGEVAEAYLFLFSLAVVILFTLYLMATDTHLYLSKKN